MSLKTVTLQPKVSRRVSPYSSVIYLSQPATQNYQITAGKNIDVPNIWELITASVQLVTTADVANRVIRMYLTHIDADGGGNAQAEYYTSDNIAASSNKSIGLYRHADLSGITQNDDFTAVIYPGSWTFMGDDTISIMIDADVAGDVASILFMFRWLNWELGLEDPGGPAAVYPPAEKPKSFWDCLGF